LTPVVWTISAQDDLAAIQANLARVSEAASARLPTRLTDRSQLLEEQPRMGRTIPEFGNELLRELIEGEYRILYEVFPDRVEVWGIAYGREQLIKDQH
jgi:toxin ParE1/3/4